MKKKITMQAKYKIKFMLLGILGIISIVLLAAGPKALAASASGLIGRGNKFYRKQAFSKALREYKQAKDQAPDSDVANFNLGTAYYQTEDFNNAEAAFRQALTSDDRLIEARANYNIGNSKSRQAQLKENSDLENSIKLYEEAVRYYKRAIELDEKDPDAKFNYEFINKRIEELRKQQEQQQQQQSRQQDKQEQEQQKQQAQTRQSDQEQESDSQEDSQEQEAQPEPGQQEDSQEEQSPDQAQEDEMSQDQARLLLEGHRQQEELQDKEKHKRSLAYPHVLKDW